MDEAMLGEKKDKTPALYKHGYFFLLAMTLITQ